MGFDIEAINVTNQGEVDSIIKIENGMLIIEIKYSKTEDEKDLRKAIDRAFTQIHEKKYFEKYLKRKVNLLAIAFNRKYNLCEFKKLNQSY
ncbi:MAG: PD-(D/E)XK nuclease domain-containing protein [Methanobrevibacter sp.]|jgi:Holliday junction resolvase-like predicted endonuclease|nr:PD-(D/E)XK nuclease domain-containing protein [Candidatus Methanovirga aequatorialis]